MIKSRSAIAAYAAAGTTAILTFGAPPGVKYRILEIRAITSIAVETMINIWVNGDLRFQMPPTLIESVFTIDDDIPEGAEIRCEVVRAAATGQIIAVSVVYEDNE